MNKIFKMLPSILFIIVAAMDLFVEVDIEAWLVLIAFTLVTMAAWSD